MAVQCYWGWMVCECGCSLLLGDGGGVNCGCSLLLGEAGGVTVAVHCYWGGGYYRR